MALILHNATVFDGGDIKRNWSIMAKGGKICSLGPMSHYEGLSGSVIDCQGMFVSPTFQDSHLHLLGNAARSMGIDLSFLKLGKMDQLLEQFRELNSAIPKTGWIRFYGFDDSKWLTDKILTRWDLDELFPDRAVLINFSSGHGKIINSRGLELLGIAESTDEPNGVTFDRDLQTGLLTGIILDGNNIIDKSMPRLDETFLQKSLRNSFNDFICRGISRVTDATENNDLGRLNFISCQLIQAGNPIGVEFMPGFKMLDDLGPAQITYGSIHKGLSIGPVKIMLSSSSGICLPNSVELGEMVNECHKKGFPVAIHAVTEEELDSALAVFSISHVYGDRIEHASETNDGQIQKIASIGLGISTQPGFLYHRGDRYISENSKDKVNNVYRLKSLIEKGIPVGGSSDAPVTLTDPINFLYSCIARKTSTNQLINRKESLSITQSLRMLTATNSDISSCHIQSNRLLSGSSLDLVILSQDISNSNEDDLLKTEILATVRSGKVEYSANKDLFK